MASHSNEIRIGVGKTQIAKTCLILLVSLFIGWFIGETLKNILKFPEMTIIGIGIGGLVGLVFVIRTPKIEMKYSDEKIVISGYFSTQTVYLSEIAQIVRQSTQLVDGAGRAITSPELNGIHIILKNGSKGYLKLSFFNPDDIQNFFSFLEKKQLL